MNKRLTFLSTLFVLALLAVPTLLWGQEIGAAARERALEVEQAAKSANNGGALPLLISVTKLVIGLVVVLLFVLLNRLARYYSFNPLANVDADFFNSAGFIVALLVGGGLFGWYSFETVDRLLPRAASEHGASIDTMMNTTLAITIIVFIATHVLLFTYPFLYRYQPGRKATYYHDNNKLEMAWTITPAIVLAIMVLMGVRTWSEYTAPAPAEAVKVSVIAQQFNWTVHYPGSDNEFGKYDYKLLKNNNYGYDSLDLKCHDDVVPAAKEIHIPIGRPVNVTIKSKDVLHGFYAPHFRAQIYAVPGMPTQVTFTPTITTADMRKELGNPKFDFEVACSQLCGASHYNMRLKVIVESEADYKKWLETQPKFMTAEQSAAVMQKVGKALASAK